jgi:hypothetical protein
MDAEEFNADYERNPSGPDPSTYAQAPNYDDPNVGAPGEELIKLMDMEADSAAVKAVDVFGTYPNTGNGPYLELAFMADTFYYARSGAGASNGVEPQPLLAVCKGFLNNG